MLSKHKIIFISALLFLAGCSKSSQTPESQSSQKSSIVYSNTSNNDLRATKTSPPQTSQSKISLFVSSPQNNSTVTSSTIQVSGQATNSQEVWVNDQQLSSTKDGSFNTTITLDEGENIILITSGNENGDSEEQELSVIYEAQ